MAARLPEDLLKRALTAAERIGDGQAKAQALGSLLRGPKGEERIGA